MTGKPKTADVGEVRGSKPHRSWQQFSLRTLLLAMLVLSVCFALFAWRLQRARRQAAAVATIRKLGGSITYDYQNVVVLANSPPPQSTVPTWLLKSLGEDFFHEVVAVLIASRSPKSQAEIDACWRGVAQLSKLDSLQAHGRWVDGRTTTEAVRHHTMLRSLSLRDSNLRCADLEPLMQLSDLQFLDLSGNPIADDVADYVSIFPKLTNLGLAQSKIGDAAMATLAENSNLAVISLNFTGVSDRGLENLAELQSLEVVMVKGTKVTPEGIKRFQQVRPGVSVH